MIDGDDTPELDLSRLKVISALGRGAKGVVFLVQSENEELLALKAICRANIERKMNGGDDSEESAYKRIWFEKEVLKRFDHPLLPRLRGTVVTEKVVGYAIDYCPGRDLNSLRKKQTEKMFSDDIIRFYAAELVLALEYLHGLRIVYRDLKPENIMIQENGHLMLVDFDLSKKLSPISPQSRTLALPKATVTKKKKLKKNRSSLALRFCNSGITPEDESAVPPPRVDSFEKSNSFVGTEEYVAPEIISGHGHGFPVDWWCLGVVLHEMLYGTTPFRGINRKETFYRILTKTPELVGEATPLRSLIRKLLEKDPWARIGLEEIRGHDFFSGVDWDSIVQLPRPPYIPTEPHEEEDNNGIDVESFVQQVFKIGNENKEETNEQKVSQSKRKQDFVNTNTSTNDGDWVDGLSPHLSPNEFSNVF